MDLDHLKLRMTKESRKSRPSSGNEPNHVQQIFYVSFRKQLPNWSDVVKFSKDSGINLNTLRDVFYKEGQAGITTMNRVLKSLLSLTPLKVEAIIDQVEKMEPVSEATRIWNSIDAPEAKRKYYALVAKSVWEIDRELEKEKSKKWLRDTLASALRDQRNIHD